ncbi:Uncharacterised protein [Serratia grimesii]|uniref:hypothetical protein n=1 Tax=Serratia grimesii TaxID=82995 RepID=UPI00076F399B|nr:hypothetical protein [Serratia grimesii]CUW11403.1 Uncharacterised protein [Serratia grimesii]SMZ56139.1 Uncharacterised protein [Serratia grimesii]
MDNKLSELSKPVAWFLGTKECKNLTTSEEYANWYVEKMSTASPLYSQEYVSALLAELEAAMKQNQELARQCGRLGARAAIAERKLATPLQLTDERTLWAGEDDYDTGHVKGWNANRIEQAALLKKQGFTVEGDE